MRAIIKNALKGLCIAVIGVSLVAVTVLTGCKGETTTKTTTAAPTVVAGGIPVISTDALAEQYDKPDWIILDTRSQSSYNGWQLFGEARGGHIEGAALFPAKWIEGVEDADLQVNLDEKGITSDKTIVVYNTDARASEDMAAKLKDLGYSKLYVYNDILEWAADETLPMQKLVHYEKLVYPDWVEELIAGNNPPTYPGNGYVIIEDMSQRGGDNTDAYDAAHIPGAIHLNRYSLEPGYPVYPYSTPKDGNLLPADQLQTAIENLGIAHDTTVIVYHSGSPSARTEWALMYAGVEDVRMLNGGYEAWVANGGTVETTPNTPTPVAFGDVPVHPEYLATTTEVAAMLKDPNAVVADTRRWEEFIGAPGSNRYIHYHFDAEGRIPGAIWFADSLADADNTFRSYTEVEQMWRDAGVTPDIEVAFY